MSRKLFWVFCLFILPVYSYAENLSSLTISVLKPPVPVIVSNRNYLIYELEIVNLSDRDVNLALVEVNDQAGKALLAYSGSMLRANIAFFQEGKKVENHDNMIKKGAVAFVYLWVETPSEAIPESLQHRIWFVDVVADKTEAVAESISFLLPLTSEKLLRIKHPVRGANWIANNGVSPWSDYRRAILPIDGKFYLPQRYAVQWQQICNDGRAVRGSVLNNEHWVAYGQDVLAVSDGTVVKVQDGITENVPTQLPTPALTSEQFSGNYVMLKITQRDRDYYALYAHLEPESIQVKVGDQVTEGQVIALLGNSGASRSPGLFFQITDADDPLKAEGVPYVFDEVTFAGQAQPLDPEYGLWKPVKMKDTRVVKEWLPMQNQLLDFTREMRFKCP